MAYDMRMPWLACHAFPSQIDLHPVYPVGLPARSVCDFLDQIRLDQASKTVLYGMTNDSCNQSSPRRLARRLTSPLVSSPVKSRV